MLSKKIIIISGIFFLIYVVRSNKCIDELPNCGASVSLDPSICQHTNSSLMSQCKKSCNLCPVATHGTTEATASTDFTNLISKNISTSSLSEDKVDWETREEREVDDDDTDRVIVSQRVVNFTSSRYCPCPCTKHRTPQTPHISTKEIIESIKQKVAIDKTKVSAYIKKKICANDDRKSAVYIGRFGIIVLTLIFLSIVLLDCVPSNSKSKIKQK